MPSPMIAAQVTLAVLSRIAESYAAGAVEAISRAEPLAKPAGSRTYERKPCGPANGGMRRVTRGSQQGGELREFGR